MARPKKSIDQPLPPPPVMQPKLAVSRRVLAAAGAGLLVIVAASGWYIWHQQTILNGNGVQALHAVQQRVSRHYVLPTNETPALATVTDTAKLTTPFFKQAKNGDKVLIYQTNHLVIMYRPSLDRLVAVGPVEIDTPKGGTSVTTPTK